MKTRIGGALPMFLRETRLVWLAPALQVAHDDDPLPAPLVSQKHGESSLDAGPIHQGVPWTAGRVE